MYASKQAGVYKSTDEGVNWIPANTGLPSVAFFRHLHVDRQSAGTVYGSSFNKDPFPVGRPASPDFWNALFKTTDGGMSWNKIGAGVLPETRAVLSFAVSPQNPATLYAGYYHPTGAELYRSTDGGTT
jgi:hypothetical protein